MDTLQFVDRLNLHCKGGVEMNIHFTDEEQALVDEVESTQTFEDVSAKRISLLHSLNSVAVSANELRKIVSAIEIQEIKLQGADQESIAHKATHLSANKKREGILTSEIEILERDILEDERNVNKRRKEITGDSGESGLVQDKLVLINQIQDQECQFSPNIPQCEVQELLQYRYQKNYL